jgi:uncharacterized membrane protein YfcA
MSMMELTLTQAVALGSFAAVTLLWSRPPMGILSWNQRATRQRAFLMFALTATSSLTLESQVHSSREGLIINVALLCAAAILWVHHLRQKGSRWTAGRVRNLTRIFALTAGVGAAFVSHAFPPYGAVLTLLAGSFYAGIMKREYAEISVIYGDLTQKLASLSAQKSSHETGPDRSKNHDNLPLAG